MLWTQWVKYFVIVMGVTCLIVVYNSSSYWTRKFYWFPKTRTGQLLWVFVFGGFILVYLILVE